MVSGVNISFSALHATNNAKTKQSSTEEFKGIMKNLVAGSTTIKEEKDTSKATTQINSKNLTAQTTQSNLQEFIAMARKT